MTTQNLPKVALYSVAALSLALSIGACGKKEQAKGPAEKAGATVGQAIDKATEQAGQAMEKAGDVLKHAGEKVQETVQEAAKK